MSEGNVEVVRRSFEHWRAGRIAEWIDTLDPDLDWDISAHPLPDFPNRGRGREALVEHIAAYAAGWNDYEAHAGELIDGGNEVVLIMHERARVRESDTVLDRDLPTVWTVRDGRSVRFRVFKTRDQALRAVGLAR